MYEELYAPLPDKEAFLTRIHETAPISCNLQELNQLICSHQYYIPFENLDVHDFHKDLSLSIGDLFHKIITQNRGGFCFELNALFHSFLVSCGYQATPCMCRIVNGKNFTPLTLHRGTIVTIENQLYFCDVGYGGPMPSAAIPVTEGAEITASGQTFRINQSDDYWWLISYYTDGAYRPILQFTTMPQEPVDFITLSYYSSTHPASVFVQKRMVNIRTPQGNKSITDMTFTVNKNGHRTDTLIKNKEELQSLLLKEFNINVSYS